MDITNLLAATFAEHELDAPDVTQTRLGIEGELARRSRRRPMLATTGAIIAVVAVAAVSIILRSAADASRHSVGLGQPPGAASRTAHMAPTGHGGMTSASQHSSTAKPAGDFPFRLGWLPPGATFDHAEVGMGYYYLEDFTFGTVPSQVRGLTVWAGDGPLQTYLRDGGVLVSTTIAGRPAVGGWSPSSRSYTLAVLRPDKTVMNVVAYGWDEATASSYATNTLSDVQYGRFPRPPTGTR